jgi:hypothetical protein
MDETVISRVRSSSPSWLPSFKARRKPVVTPAGGLGCHVNALQFLSHVTRTHTLPHRFRCSLYCRRRCVAWSVKRSPNNRSGRHGADRFHGASAPSPCRGAVHMSQVLYAETTSLALRKTAS